VPRLAKDPTQLAKTEGLPEFVQCPDVAQRTRRFEFDRRQLLTALNFRTNLASTF
jgi:hypothetical protein